MKRARPEPAEARILCACARRRAQTPDVALPDDVGTDPDWDAVLRLADTHGVAELLTAPCASGTLTVPPSILADLTQRELEATGLNLNRTTQVVEVLGLLAAHQIHALTFKGPALAQAVYGHLGRRVSNDIDILVDRRDVSRVRQVLLDNGYRVPPGAPRKGSLIHGLLPSAGRDDTLLPTRPGQTSVDVHVAFAHWTMGIRLDVRAMFDRATTVRIAGQTVPTLCPDDLLPVLAIHGMMHGWHALRLVSDIDAVVDCVSDWDAVIRRTEEARMARVLWVALMLAEHLLGTSLPQAVATRAARDTAAMAIVDKAVDRMFDPRASTGSWSHHRWLPLFLDGPSRRFGYHARDVIERGILRQPWHGWLRRREANHG